MSECEIGGCPNGADFRTVLDAETVDELLLCHRCAAREHRHGTIDEKKQLHERGAN